MGVYGLEILNLNGDAENARKEYAILEFGAQKGTKMHGCKMQD